MHGIHGSIQPRNGNWSAGRYRRLCAVSSILLAAFLMIAPAGAWAPPSSESSAELLIQPSEVLRERCAQGISLYDRYGASRTENSDGQRNHTRIGAEIDCREGRYADGILAIEDLLRRKNF